MTAPDSDARLADIRRQHSPSVSSHVCLEDGDDLIDERGAEIARLTGERDRCRDAKALEVARRGALEAEIARLRSQAAPSGDALERAAQIIHRAYEAAKGQAENDGAERGWSTESIRMMTEASRFGSLRDAVAAAITAAEREATERERERCAVIAEQIVTNVTGSGAGPSGSRIAARCIAASIRALTPQTPAEAPPASSRTAPGAGTGRSAGGTLSR